MVDRLTNNTSSSIADLGLGALQTSQQVERTKTDAAGKPQAAEAVNPFADAADISDAAKTRMESEKEVMKFASLASRQDEPVDTAKVRAFKDLLDSGKINQYFNSLDNKNLAAILLQNRGVKAGLA